ncbi:hypothetical protein GCM10023238_12310 [Streptomyces heliomycini]
MFRSTAHSDRVPSLVLDEDRDVLSPTWLGPLDGGGAVVERISAAGPHAVTLQDARADGSDPRDLGLTILDEDPAADTHTDSRRGPAVPARTRPRPVDRTAELHARRPPDRRHPLRGRRRRPADPADLDGGADGSNAAP